MLTKRILSALHHSMVSKIFNNYDLLKMKLTVRILTTLLRSMVSKTFNNCDLKLAHVVLTYNGSLNYSTGHSSFEVVYGINYLTPINLIPINITHKLTMNWISGYWSTFV